MNRDIDVIDIGLSLQEALDLGLEPEEFERTEALPQGLALSDLEKEYFEGELAGPKKWTCRRIELNDLAADPMRFIRWTEDKLEEHCCASKLMPPKHVILKAAESARRERLRVVATEMIKKTVDIDSLVEKVVTKMAKKLPVRDVPGAIADWALKLRSKRWDLFLSELLEDRAEGLTSDIQSLVIEALENSDFKNRPFLEGNDLAQGHADLSQFFNTRRLSLPRCQRK